MPYPQPTPHATTHTGSPEPTLWVHQGDENTGAPHESSLHRTRHEPRRLRPPTRALFAEPGRHVAFTDWAELPELCAASSVADIVIGYPARPRLLQEFALSANRCGCGFHMTAGMTPAVDAAADLPAEAMPSSRVVLTAPSTWPHTIVADAEVFSRVRRATDVALAVTTALIFLPVALLSVVAVSLESRGAPIFVQTRIGWRGRPFKLFKLRTMHRTAPHFAPSPADDDGRVTRVGRILRASGLDEIPQLLNILRGDMTFVGPRPEMPYLVEQYTSVQRERLAVRPGLTGLWQLRGDRHAAIHSQIEFDLYYIAFRTRALDVRLLAETAVFALRGCARAVWPPTRRENRAAGTGGTEGVPGHSDSAA